MLLSRDDLFPDALAGNSLAGVVDGAAGAPILLSRNSDVPNATMAEIQRLGADTVVLLGEENALDASVAAELAGAGLTVSRLGGENRYETMNEIANTIPSTSVYTPAEGRTAFLATGQAFPDALAAGSPSYAETVPMVLTKSDTLNTFAEQTLTDLAIDHVVILGGADAVSASVEAAVNAMGITSERLAGANRFQTAKAIADWALAEFGWSDEHVDVATGQAFPDALTGGPHAGENTAPIILVRSDSVPAAARTYFEEHSTNTIQDGHIFGGTDAVSAAVEAELEAIVNDAEAVTNQDFTVTPAEAAENTLATEPSTTDDRQYSISGLDDAASYDIFLFPAENVSDTNGQISFADADDNNVADWTATNADITVVNGTATGDTNGTVLSVSPVNGTISFTIDADAADQVIPVLVAHDAAAADAAPDVDLDADNEPTEEFGIGGQKTWIPAEAAQGDIGAADEAIESANKDLNRFSTADATYFYDANDTFFVVAGQAGAAVDEATDDCTAGDQVTLAEFEAEVSAGDELEESSVYQPNPDLSSSLCLEDLDPAEPTNLTAAAQDSDTILVDWDAVTGADSYNVYRTNDPDQTDGLDDCVDPDTDATGYSVVGTTNAATTQFTDNGLNPETEYCYAVTAVNDGDESTFAGPAHEETPAVGDTPTITDAQLTTDTGLVGIATANDIWELTFSEGMDATTATGGQFVLTDPDGDQILVQCGLAVAADDIVSATCALSDEDATAGNETLTITLGEDASAEDRNAAGDGTVEYPLTITNVNDQVQDDDDGNTVSLAGSSDVVVDDETP